MLACVWDEALLIVWCRSITDEINVRHQGAVNGGASVDRTPAADTHSVKINGSSSIP